MSNVLLDIKKLKIWYKTYRGYAEVVDGIDLHVNKGEKVGLVGESGCGKTSTVKTVLRIIDETSSHIDGGEIFFNDKDILKMNNNELQKVRRKKIAMISQEPSAALNPVFTIGQTMGEVIKYSIDDKKISKSDIQEMSVNAIKNVKHIFKDGNLVKEFI